MRSSGGARRTGRSEGGSGNFAKEMVSGPSSAGGTSGAQAASPLSALNGLLALQEVDDAGARSSRGKRRGIQILDMLEELRLGLLAGGIPRGKLLDLTRVVQAQRDRVDDPRLMQILDEIDLRAQVELAKYAP
jgi:hypothetical protein